MQSAFNGLITWRSQPLHVSWGEILHFKYPCVSAVNRIATQTLRDKKQQQTTPILSFELILMSTLMWITEKELEIKSKGGQFR